MTQPSFFRPSARKLMASACIPVLGALLCMTPSAAMADCVNPAGPEGRLIYNSTHKVAQVCDGTNWISLGGGGTGGGGSITVPGADTQVIFNDNGVLGAHTDLVYNKTNSRLGIGVASPTQQLDIAGTATAQGILLKGVAGDPPAPLSAPVLNALADVDTSAAANGRVLTYNSGTSTWEAAAISGGTLSGGTAGYLGVWSGASALGTSGTSAGQQLFWDGTNHRLGIGTTTPAFTLDVAGAFRVNSAASWPIVHAEGSASNAQYPGYFIAMNSRGGSHLQASDALGVLSFRSAVAGVSADVVGIAPQTHTGSSTPGDLVFRTTPVGSLIPQDRVIINNAGNVGIGITAPTLNTNGTVLHVHQPDSTWASAIHITNGATGSGSADGLILGRWNGGQSYNLLFSYENEDLRIGTNGSEVIIIKPSGNVGIGTSNPVSRLDVGGTSPTIGLSHSGSTGLILLDWTEGNQYVDFDGNLYFRDGINGVGNNNPLTITTSGAIGIGTILPTQRLDVRGPVNMSYDGSAYDVWIQGGGSGGGNARNLALLGNNNSNGDTLWLNYYSEYTGGTFIGGPIYFHNLSNAAYNYPLCINGSGGWVGYAGACAASDRRMKENIVTVDGALAKIATLNGVTFDWKDAERKKNDGRQMGLIAQDVEKVFPEAIIHNRPDKMLGMNYDSLAGAFVEAFKELKKITDDMNDKVQQLKAENDALRAQHDADIKSLRAEIEALKAARQ